MVVIQRIYKGLGKPSFTIRTRYAKRDIPLLSIPYILMENICNAIRFGGFKIISYKAHISSKGKLDINGRLMINLFSNTKNADVREHSYIQNHPNGHLKIDGNVEFSNGVKIDNNGLLQIGAGSYLNARTCIICRERIVIGKNVAIAWDVTIMDTDAHGIGDHGRIAPIQIEDNVWIGAKAFILKGVKIGAHAVVASNSVVTKDVPEGHLVAGNPAQLIRKIEKWN